MTYLEFLYEIAAALFPLAMFLNGFSLGYLVADDLRERAQERREKKKAAANQTNFTGHEGPGSKQEPTTKAKP